MSNKDKKDKVQYQDVKSDAKSEDLEASSAKARAKEAEEQLKVRDENEQTLRPELNPPLGVEQV